MVIIGEMTDSEDDSSQSLQQDRMSVSDVDDAVVSREDDMPSAELEAGFASSTHDEFPSSSTSASSSSEISPDFPVDVNVGHNLKSRREPQFSNTVDLDDAAVTFYVLHYFANVLPINCCLFSCRWN